MENKENAIEQMWPGENFSHECGWNQEKKGDNGWNKYLKIQWLTIY